MVEHCGIMDDEGSRKWGSYGEEVNMATEHDTENTIKRRQANGKH